MQHQHSSKGLTSKVTTEKKMNNQPVKANKRNPSGMCSRIKREGIPETHCLQSARTRARRGVMRLFIMMSDLRSCGYSTRCIERENCSFCRAVALCKREMTHNVPRTARCLNDRNVGRQSPAIATRPSDACICSSPSAYKYMITTVSYTSCETSVSFLSEERPRTAYTARLLSQYYFQEFGQSNTLMFLVIANYTSAACFFENVPLTLLRCKS